MVAELLLARLDTIDLGLLLAPAALGFCHGTSTLGCIGLEVLALAQFLGNAFRGYALLQLGQRFVYVAIPHLHGKALLI